MQLERLTSYFATSPAIRLLRSPHAPYVIYFLDQQFKEAERITRTHAELAAAWTSFQEGLRNGGKGAWGEMPRGKAEQYLRDWSGGGSRWLLRHLQGGVDEPVYELSPESEVVLKFLRDTLDREARFVGTESRLRRILETLSDLVVRGSDDPQQRLEFLRGERQRIDDEIAAIVRDGVVSTYSPTAIRERFSEAVSDLDHLQSDFRAVEESFKEITRAVQRKQSDPRGARGAILGFALDAEEALKSDDQGISFHEFVRLMLSPRHQEVLEETIVRLSEIPELVDQVEGLRRIDRMVPSLLAEAQKVLRTTQRLSMTLRRLLDTRTSAGRMRLAETIGEIRQLASQLAEDPPLGKVGLSLETEVELGSPAEKSFWSPAVSFERAVMREAATDDDDRLAAFKALAQLRRLDWSQMRRVITSNLQHRPRLTLAELLELNPPQGGIIEVLGYLQIAHDDGHHVDPDQTDAICLRAQAAGSVVIDLPHVVFVPPNRSRAAANVASPQPAGDV